MTHKVAYETSLIRKLLENASCELCYSVMRQSTLFELSSCIKMVLLLSLYAFNLTQPKCFRTWRKWSCATSGLSDPLSSKTVDDCMPHLKLKLSLSISSSKLNDMKYATGDLFSYPTEVIVIPTNGVVKRNGTAVMDKGVALQAAKRWPQLPIDQGESLTRAPTCVNIFKYDEKYVITFKTKGHWKDDSLLSMVEKSAQLLKTTIDYWDFETVVLPRVSCGEGHLTWDQVEPILSKYLDDRFVVVTPA